MKDKTGNSSMYKILISFCLLIITIPSVFCKDRDTSSFISIGLQGHYGFIIPHSASIREISHTNPVGVEINYNVLHTSLEKYKVFNTFWTSGMELRYINFQNPEVLGGVFDFSFFAEPVLGHWRNYLMSVRCGAGFSYHTKVYDPVENPLNMYFSSRISFPLFVDLRFKYRLGERINITLSGCYNHISNGGVKQPNKGMNFPTLAMGLEYSQNAMPVLHHDFKVLAEKKRPAPFIILQTLTSVKVLGGMNEVPEKTAFIFGLHSRYAFPLGPYYAINTGGEFIIDGYIKETIFREQRNIDHKRLALTMGQDFMLGRMIFSQHIGFYLFSPYKPPDPVYQKYELAYRVHKHLNIGFYLKAHLQVAELMGVHANWVLPLKKHKSTPY